MKRHLHTFKVMRIGSKLILIVCVHTECALTAMHIQSIHFHMWFEVGLKVNYIMTCNSVGVIFACDQLHEETRSVTLLLRLGSLLYLLCHV